MKPICAACNLFFRPKKNGVYFEEGMPVSSATDSGWTSYKLWVGDLWECRSCGAQIIVGVPHTPVAEHYQPGYRERVAKIHCDRRIDDC